jgi:2-oxoisovalerate dehydrogenase E1 component
MTFIREFESRCLELSRKGVVQGSIHLSFGQEAIPVGVCAALQSRDRVLATYRGHGWALSRGVPLIPMLAEVCQRAGGINGGRCGSPLLSAPEYGFFGENSIVGAGVPIAAGLGLASLAQDSGRVAVVSIGDGAMNQGSVHEGIVFAAARNLPLVIVCENNGWSEMTHGSAFLRGSNLIDRVRGYHVAGEIVDGCDAEEVLDAAQWAVAEARAGRGPVFLECKTVRLSGHYNGDIQHYRPQSDTDEAKRREPLARLRQRIVSGGIASDADLDAIEAGIAAELDSAAAEVLAMEEPPLSSASEHIVAPPAATDPPAGTHRGAETTEALTYQRAINRALRTELASRPEVLVYGEDVGAAGGIFGVSRGLQKEFGAERVFDTPISESAIIGSAVGAAMEGMRPVIEIMWGDFLLVAMDQLVNQAANVRFINRSGLHAPMVLRFQQGVTPGSCAQHSQSLEAFLAHVPGLKVGVPATPADAYAMTRAAVSDPDPCVLAEARELYQMSGEVKLGGPVEAIGGARLHRRGESLAIITWGPMLWRALEAADRLAEVGQSAAVLDLRWLRPLDDTAIDQVVREAGGRVIVAHEANLTGGFGAEIAARISERHFGGLVAPVLRVAALDTRIPAAPALQRAVIPGVQAILDAAAFLADPGLPADLATRGAADDGVAALEGSS